MHFIVTVVIGDTAVGGVAIARGTPPICGSGYSIAGFIFNMAAPDDG